MYCSRGGYSNPVREYMLEDDGNAVARVTFVFHAQLVFLYSVPLITLQASQPAIFTDLVQHITRSIPVGNNIVYSYTVCSIYIYITHVELSCGGIYGRGDDIHNQPKPNVMHSVRMRMRMRMVEGWSVCMQPVVELCCIFARFSCRGSF